MSDDGTPTITWTRWGRRTVLAEGGELHARAKEAHRIREANDERWARERPLNSKPARRLWRPLKHAGVRIPFETELGNRFVPTGLTSIIIGDIEEGYEVSLLIWGHVALLFVVATWILGRGVVF